MTQEPLRFKFEVTKNKLKRSDENNCSQFIFISINKDADMLTT